MLASLFAVARDAIFPPDPGAIRLRAALQATLAGLLTFCVVVLLGQVMAVPSADRILGFAVGLFTSVVPRDSSRTQQAVAMALVVPAASVTTAAAALVLHQELVAAMLMPCIIAVVIYGAAHQARWGAVGAMALIAYMIGMVTRLPPDTLPVRVLIICVGVASAALFRFVVLPESPEAELQRLRRDIRRGIAQLLTGVDAAIEAGTWAPLSRSGLERQQDRLTVMIVLAQTRIWAMPSPPPGLGLHLLELELATERVIRVSQHDLGAATDRSALRASIAHMRSGLESPAMPDLAEGIAIPDLAARASPLSRALAGLAQVLREPPADGPGPAPSPPPPPARPSTGLRQAIQGGIATAFAVVAGELVSPQRWYWAAFAAFAMFQGTRSRGESIAKEIQFLIGTLAGVFAGVLIAAALNGHEMLTMAAIVGALFLAWQAFPAAYGVMVFWITIILGLMFGMLGYFPTELLLLRLKESAAGAVCGIIVACIVLTRPERRVADEATLALLRAIGQAVDAAARLLLGEPASAALPSALLDVENRFAAVRAASVPELRGLGVARHGRLRRRLVLLNACTVWIRSLGRISLGGQTVPDPAAITAIRTMSAQIAHTVAALTHETAGALQAEAEAAARIEATGNAARVVRVLRLIDVALLHIAAGMTSPARGTVRG